MTISIRDQETERLAQQLASETGMTVDQAITDALRVRLAIARPPAPSPRPMTEAEAELARREVERLQLLVKEMPVLDARPGDDILYDEFGLPK